MDEPRVDYDEHGRTYTRHRRPDPRIAARIRAALGDARTVVNVGAGAGSYEPADLDVTAVEPSAVMRAQRPPGAAPVVDARAERLPFADDTSTRRWPASRSTTGSRRRRASRRCGASRAGRSSCSRSTSSACRSGRGDYLAEALEIERPRFPSIALVEQALGGRTRVERIATPGDCEDGFFEAFWRRPEALVDPTVRASQSLWALLPDGAEERIVRRLERDLASGEWDARHGHLRAQDSFDGSLRLVISEPG